MIHTPHIDKMASEGIRFTDCYSGDTVCAPARSTLMTGYHIGHTRVRGNDGKTPLHPEDVTVAEVLKKAGYVARIEREGDNPVAIRGLSKNSGFNEINLYALKRLAEDPDVTPACTVGEVMRESATAVAMARQALAKLEKAKSAGLGDAHYERYRHQLDKLLETAELWAGHHNAFIKSRSGGLAPSFDGPFPVGGPPRHSIIPSDAD